MRLQLLKGLRQVTDDDLRMLLDACVEALHREMFHTC
jgi:hypothetical protein